MAKLKMSPEEKTIKEFSEWVESVPKQQLVDLVKRSYWHKQLRGTEIQRFFELHQHGVDLRQLERPGIGKLNSPYGAMSVNGKNYKNGHIVVNQRLKGVRDSHLVTAHWITLDIGEPEPKVHILDGGTALCGRKGLPKDWEKNESWVSLTRARKATCAGCVAVWSQPAFEKVRDGG